MDTLAWIRRQTWPISPSLRNHRRPPLFCSSDWFELSDQPKGKDLYDLCADGECLLSLYRLRDLRLRDNACNGLCSWWTVALDH